MTFAWILPPILHTISSQLSGGFISDCFKLYGSGTVQVLGRYSVLLEINDC